MAAVAGSSLWSGKTGLLLGLGTFLGSASSGELNHVSDKLNNICLNIGDTSVSSVKVDVLDTVPLWPCLFIKTMRYKYCGVFVVGLGCHPQLFYSEFPP